MIAKLPQAQHELLRLWVLGGAEAIGKHSTRTVEALIARNLIDGDGPTGYAKRYIDHHETKSHGE